MINDQQSRRYFEDRLGTKLPARAELSLRCPFHEDSRPSFSLNADKGAWICHAGCGQGGILDFEQQFAHCDRDTARKQVDELLGEKLFSTGNGHAVKTYRYTDARGKLLYEKLRFEPKTFRYRREDENGAWVWTKGDRTALYRLPELVTAASVIYVEGERDAENVLAAVQPLELANFAVTTSGGANDWRDEYAPYFAGRTVIILPDNDTPGHAHAQQVAAAIHKHAAGVKIVDLPGLPPAGDVSDYLETHSGQDLLNEIRQQKRAWTPQVQATDWRSLFHSRDEFENAPDVAFAIDGFLQEEGITLLGSLPGHGKTLCMLAITRALLEGGKLFTRFQATRRSDRVLYLIPECGLGPFKTRLKTFRLLDYVGVSLFVQTLSSKEPLALTDPRLLHAAEGADVILDTAIRFMDGDENAAADQRMFARNLFDLQKAGARTIIGAHHSVKSSGKDNFMTLENILRGSGDIGAMAATVWGLRQIEPISNEIYVSNVKPRDFQPCEPFVIKGRPCLDETGYFEMPKPPGYAGELCARPGRPKVEGREEAETLRAQGYTYEQIAGKLDVSMRTVCNWLKKG